MRLLLTGKDGQLGQALHRDLSPLGTVVATGRTELDLSDPRAIAAAVRDAGPDVVVNAAAYTAVDQAETEPDVAAEVNALAPGHLAVAARRAGAALIHYSTDYVFDGRRRSPYPEDAPANPVSAYGASKAAGEAAVRAAGVPHLIVRTSWVYAAAGRNFLLTMLRLGRERDVISVVDDQVGAPTPASVIAATTVAVIAGTRGEPARFLETAGGTVNVTCRGATSWYGFAREIFRQAARHGMPLSVRELRPIPTEAYPVPARRPANSRLDLRRLRDRFGVVPPHWRTALTQVMDQMTPVPS